MKKRPKYKVKIYDEAHLIEKGGFALTWPRIIGVTLIIALVFIAIGIGLVWFTPIKNSLPGYLRTEQRIKTEEAWMRIDSLEQLYILHQAYLDNIVKVLNSEREPDILDTTASAVPLFPDSLMVSSEIEREFMKKMEEAGYVITINQDYEEADTPQ